MSWKLSAAAERLRAEINTLFPGRDKASDGAVGDTAHSARESDHNPDENGWVRAIDIDEDVWGKNNQDPTIANVLAARLAAIGKMDPRIKYVIFEGKIWSKSLNWKGRPYDGPNPHGHHIHVSFNKCGDEDGSPFGLVAELKQEVAAAKPVVVKKSTTKEKK